MVTLIAMGRAVGCFLGRSGTAVTLFGLLGCIAVRVVVRYSSPYGTFASAGCEQALTCTALRRGMAMRKLSPPTH